MVSGIVVSVAVFVALGILSYLGALYTAKTNKSNMLVAMYVLFLTMAQFLAVRGSSFDFMFIQWVAPAGVIVFPFTLQLTDMVNEKFGRKEVHQMIIIAWLTQVILVFFIIVAVIPGYVNLGSSETDPLGPFGIVPRITIASWIAFLVSENFDAWVYDRIKQFFEEKKGGQWWKYLWIRNVVSDVLSLAIDSLIFIPLAFFGLSSFDLIITAIIGQIAVKWLLGVIDTPFMYMTRWIYESNSSVETNTEPIPVTKA